MNEIFVKKKNNVANCRVLIRWEEYISFPLEIIPSIIVAFSLAFRIN